MVVFFVEVPLLPCESYSSRTNEGLFISDLPISRSRDSWALLSCGAGLSYTTPNPCMGHWLTTRETTRLSKPYHLEHLTTVASVIDEPGSQQHMAERKPQNLEKENKKLRSQHREMSEDLSEQREMVRHLHGVIKSYEKLLRKTGQTSRQTGSPRQSINGRNRVGKGCEAEDVFVRKVLESAKPEDKGEKTRNVSCPALTYKSRQNSSDAKADEIQRKNNSKATKHRGGISNSLPRSANSPGLERRRTATRKFGRSEKAATKEVKVRNFKRSSEIPKKLSCPASVSPAGRPSGQAEASIPANSNREEPSKHHQESATRDFSWSYKPMHNMIADMNSVVDSMMRTVEHQQQSLKIKERHLVRSERRIEYLESIALGQESEWLWSNYVTMWI